MCVRASEVWPRQTPGTAQRSATFHLRPQKYAHGEFICTDVNSNYSTVSVFRRCVCVHINTRSRRWWKQKQSHSHTCVDTETQTEGKTSETWAPPRFFLFCPSPWWCVMFRGDNRCHGEPPSVPALWGTLMTHTRTRIRTLNRVSTSSSFSGPWEPQMTLHSSRLSLPPSVSFFFFPSLSLRSSLLLSRTHSHLPQFWATVPLGDVTSSTLLKSLCLFPFVSTLNPDVTFIDILGDHSATVPINLNQSFSDSIFAPYNVRLENNSLWTVTVSAKSDLWCHDITG